MNDASVGLLPMASLAGKHPRRLSPLSLACKRRSVGILPPQRPWPAPWSQGQPRPVPFPVPWHLSNYLSGFLALLPAARGDPRARGRECAALERPSLGGPAILGGMGGQARAVRTRCFCEGLPIQ